MEMSVKDVVGQAQKVLEIMRQTMRAGIHYGAVIPGTNKHSLLKPGAERLCLTFRLAPSFNIRRQDLDGGHREYEIVATLRHQPTDMVLGEGVGCASTMESKYRWRWENTGRLVPPDYWKARDPSLLGGSDFVARKIAEKWWVFHRIEFDSPADYHNTVLKIAKKRALVDVVLTATAASDVFSHEVERPRKKPPKRRREEPGQDEPPK